MTLINLTNKNDFQAINFLFYKIFVFIWLKLSNIKLISFLFKVFNLIYEK